MYFIYKVITIDILYITNWPKQHSWIHFQYVKQLVQWMCQLSAWKDKPYRLQVVLIFETRFKCIFAKVWLKQLQWRVLMYSDFWGHYHDFAWQLCSYLTLNLVKVEGEGKREEGNIRQNGPLSIPISFSVQLNMLLVFVLVNQAGIMSQNSICVPVCVFNACVLLNVHSEPICSCLFLMFCYWKAQPAHTHVSMYKFVIHNNKTLKETPTEES